MIRQVK